MDDKQETQMTEAEQLKELEEQIQKIKGLMYSKMQSKIGPDGTILERMDFLFEELAKRHIESQLVLQGLEYLEKKIDKLMEMMSDDETS